MDSNLCVYKLDILRQGHFLLNYHNTYNKQFLLYNGYKISGEGQGGVAGFAKGGAAVKLEDSDGGTKLTYTAEAEVGGKPASVGSRLVEGVAKKTADDFFGKFAEIVSIDSKLEYTDTKAAQVQQVAEGSSKTSDNSRLFWGVGAAVAIVAILYTIFG